MAETQNAVADSFGLQGPFGNYLLECLWDLAEYAVTVGSTRALGYLGIPTGRLQGIPLGCPGVQLDTPWYPWLPGHPRLPYGHPGAPRGTLRYVGHAKASPMQYTVGYPWRIKPRAPQGTQGYCGLPTPPEGSTGCPGTPR